MPSAATTSRRRPLLVSLMLAAAVLLAGCAGVLRVDSQVESFARWDERSGLPAAPQRYQFERLPSQHQGQVGKAQTDLEQWTRDELAALGWHLAGPSEAAPGWRVTVQAQSVRSPFAPWEVPHGGYWPGISVYGGWGRPGFGARFGFPLDPWWDATPYYQRAVSIVIRDAATGQVAYETSAAHDSRWHSTPGLWQAMIRAALAGFPAPPQGVRQVNIDLPR